MKNTMFVKAVFVLFAAMLLCFTALAVPEAVTVADSANDIVVDEKEQTADFFATYGDLSYSVYNGKATITNCSTSVTSVVIPTRINGYNVTSIGSSAFEGCSSLTSITIPEGVTSIGGSAFRDCSSLTSITIPENVTSIGSYTFCGCSSLTSMTIPESVKSIGWDAFYGCSSLEAVYTPSLEDWCSISFGSSTSNPLYYAGNLYINNVIASNLTIPESVTSIGNYAFYNCSSLTSITIPESVTSIGDYTFYNCTSLTSITIPESVTSIGEDAFYNCSSLTSITIPESVTSIGEGTFKGCSSLEEITLPFIGQERGITGNNNSVFGYVFGKGSYYDEGVTEQYYKGSSSSSYYIPSSLKRVTITDETLIPYGAFYNCKNLESITVNEGVTGTGISAFYNCDGLTSFSFPSSITSIDAASFSNCTGFTSFTIPEGVTSIGEDAFCNCSSLTSITISQGVTSIGSYAFSGCSSLTSIAIPNSVTSIGEDAFYNCSSLTSITFSQGVTSIGEDAFYNCTKLKAVYTPSLEDWCSISFGSSTSNPLYYAGNLYINGIIATNVTIPESVTSIENYAFYNSGITGVTIHDKVESIGESAFGSCDYLRLVKIGSGISGIGTDAFSNCPVIQQVHIYDIAKWCEIEFGNSASNPLGISTSFYISGKLAENIVIPDTVSKISSYAFYNCSQIKKITIPGSVESIGEYAFSDCTGITEITIPDSVESIGNFTFYDCTGITEITIPDSVESIGNFAFYDCTGITEIIIPDSVESIGEHAFSGCTKLSNADISDKVKEIKAGTFYNCSALKSITLPESLETIGAQAFGRCSLSSIEIPASVTNIASCAFGNGYYSSSKLDAVYISDLEAWCNITFGDYYANPLNTSSKFFLNGALVEELYIPSSITTIKAYSFDNADCIKKLFVPIGVRLIETGAFADCDNIEEIYYEGSSDMWLTIQIAQDNYNVLNTPPFYADFVPGEVKIIFDKNTTDDVTNMPEVGSASGAYTFPTRIPERRGYKFLGWANTPNGYVVFVPGQQTEIYEQITMYAVWEKIVTIFDNPIRLEAQALTSQDGESVVVIINLSNSLGFGKLVFDVEYDSSVLNLGNVMPAFASQYCSIDSSQEGKIHFEFSHTENIIGNGVVALINLSFNKQADKKVSDIVIAPEKQNCFGYDVNNDNNESLLGIDVVNVTAKKQGDVNGDGKIDIEDAIYLLQYSMFPDDYPLN